MVKDNDDSLEFDNNDSDMDVTEQETDKEIEQEPDIEQIDESSFDEFSVEDFFSGFDDVSEETMEKFEAEEASGIGDVFEKEETFETEETSVKEGESEEKVETEGMDMSSSDVHNEENSSDLEQEDSSNDFDDLFSLLGMGDVDEQEIFSSMMDSIPDSDDEGKSSDSAMNEDIEVIEEEINQPAASSKNNIYSDVLSTVGSLADKEQEEQIMSELEDIEDRTNSKKKKKKKKGKEEKKQEKEKKLPKEKKDISTLLFGEEEPETQEEILAREKKEAEKASKKEAKARQKEEKKKLAEDKKNQAKEKAKIKKEKESENVDPEDLKPVNKTALFLCVFVFFLIALFIVMGTTMFHYALTVKKASDYFDRKKYNMAYEEIIGVEVKEEDEELRDKIYTVMYVERAYLSYNIYVDMGSYDKALNMLLSGLEKYDEYYPQGMALGIEEDMDYCRNKIVNSLYDDYGMDLNDAYDMIALDDIQYQLQVIEKSKEFKEK